MAEQLDEFDPDAAAARNRALAENAEFNDSIKAAVDAGLNKNWFSRMPQNIGIGGYKAVLNTLETEADLAEALAERKKLTAAASAVTGVPVAVLGLGAQKIAQFAPTILEPMRALAEEWTQNNTLGDDITQGVAQFAIPFAAYMRAAGGIQMGQTAVNLGRAAVAEGLAAGTAFDPHDGRFADLVQLGRESEGRFGDVLRKVSPDGSLVNSYINWMTSRDNEGKWEGRFKNAVDSLVGSAAVGGILKGAATGFRVVKKLAAEPMKVGAAAQRGSVGVPPAVDELDDITRARALKNTEVVEGGEHVVLEGDTLNTNADVVPLHSNRFVATLNQLEQFVAQERNTQPDLLIEQMYKDDPDRLAARYIEARRKKLPPELEESLQRLTVMDQETGETLNAFEDGVRGGHIGQLRRLRDQLDDGE